MVLEFIKNCPPYVLGDIAGINDKLAKKLIDSKYAIEYKEKVEENKNNIQDSAEEKTENEKQPEQTEINIPKDEEKPKQNKNSKK